MPINLLGAAVKHFGSWNIALESVGVDLPKFWTKSRILMCIQRLSSEGIPLNSGFVQRNKDSIPKILSPITGRNINGCSLHAIAQKNFGSWDKALFLAGLEPAKIRRDNKPYWSKEVIIRSILELNRCGVPLYYQQVKRDQSQKTKDILFREVRKKTSGYGLVSAAYLHFGSWEYAIRAAGLESVRIITPWSKSDIFTGLEALKKNAIPLSYKAIAHCSEVNQILSSALRRPVTGHCLHKHAKKFFGSWDNALAEVGVDPTSIPNPHQFWTKDIIIQCIKRMEAEHIPFNFRNGPAEIERRAEEIILLETRRKITRLGFQANAGKYFGTFRNALVAAGFEPDRYCRKRCYWTRENVATAIAALHNSGVSLNSSKISRDKSPRTSDIIKKATGFHSTGVGLWASSQRFYTWKEALTAAGLSPAKIMRGHPYRIAPGMVHENSTTFWTEKRMLDGINAIAKAKIPMAANKIQYDGTERTSRVIGDAIGVPMAGRKLYVAALKYFGKWDKALTAAGLDPEVYIVPRRWTRRRVLRAIEMLNKANVPLNCGTLDDITATSVILQLNTNLRSTKSLVQSATALFGSWDEAPRASNLDPLKIRRAGFWKKESIVNAIRELQAAKVPLQVSKIVTDFSETTGQIIFRATGHEANGRALVSSAKWNLGSWDLALEAAGINPEEIRMQKYRWQGRTILRGIRRLHRNEVPLNSGNIRNTNPESSAILKRAVGRDIGTSTLYYQALKKFGSWDEALRQAKINPDEIRRKSRTTSNLSVTPHQEEWIESNDGIWRRQILFGTPSKTPEELLEEKENCEILQRAINSLSPQDKIYIDGVLSSNADLGEQREANEKKSGTSLECRTSEILGRIRIHVLFRKEMEELHQLSSSYFPSSSEGTIPKLLDHFEEINSLLNRGGSMWELCQRLRGMEVGFRALFSRVHNPSYNDHESSRILDFLATLQSDLLKDGPLVLRQRLFSLKERCIDYCREIRRRPIESEMEQPPSSFLQTGNF